MTAEAENPHPPPKNQPEMPQPGPTLEDSTRGIVSIFTDLAELFGNPRSYGQIYGLLFASNEPLTMEAIGQRLEISQGSTSQGLRQLEAFGAVVKTKGSNDRFARYTAKLEMKHLISGFLSQRVIPRLESTASRVEALQISLASQPLSSDTAAINFRLNRLAKWHRRAQTLLPLTRQILGGL